MAPKKSPHQKVHDELRAFALSLPGAKEEFPWGDRVAKVNGKIFFFVGINGDTGGLGLAVKLPESCEGALELPWTKPTGYGLGRAGWVSAKIPVGEKPPVEMLRAWIEESYRAIAPKKLIRQLDGDGFAPAAKRRR